MAFVFAALVARCMDSAPPICVQVILDFVWAFVPGTGDGMCIFLFPVTAIAVAAAHISFVARSESSFSFHNSFPARRRMSPLLTWHLDGKNIFILTSHCILLVPVSLPMPVPSLFHGAVLGALFFLLSLFALFIFAFISCSLFRFRSLQLIARTFAILIMRRKYVFTFLVCARSARARYTIFPQHNLIAYTHKNTSAGWLPPRPRPSPPISL